MNNNVEVLRNVIAWLLILISTIMILFYVFQSLKLAFQATRGDPTIILDKIIPQHYAIIVMAAAILAIIGFVLLIPGLIRLVPIALLVATIVSISVWLNLRIRLHLSLIHISQPTTPY